MVDDAREVALGDRILVRPYIQPVDPPEPPARHDPPVVIAGDPPTAILPVRQAIAPPPTEVKDRGMVLWLVGAGLAVVVAAAVVMIALWPRGDDGGQPDPADAPALGMDGGAGPQPPAFATARASASPSAATPSRATASATPSRPPTTPPSRTGAIANPNGLCLDAGDGAAGAAVSAHDCTGAASQRWTAAADGTLRIGGLCAAASAGGVRLAGCGGDMTRWRTGPGGTLVNAGSGQCLADPRNGAKAAARVRLAPCDDGSQRWTVP